VSETEGEGVGVAEGGMYGETQGHGPDKDHPGVATLDAITAAAGEEGAPGDEENST
jgi:hypothetical protein